MTFTLALLTSLAWSQASPIAPFVGDLQDDMSPGTGVAPCVPSVAGDLCSLGGSFHKTGSWGFMCGIGGHDTPALGASSGGAAEINIDAGASRFGGYFGTNSGDFVGITFRFYNSADELVDTHVDTTAPCGEYLWYGWSFSESIHRVEVENSEFGGAFIQMDDLEFDTAPAGPPTITLTQDTPAIPGEWLELSATYPGGMPDGHVLWVMFAVGEGPGPCPDYLGGACWDLISPRNIARMTADESGDAFSALWIPRVASPGASRAMQVGSDTFGVSNTIVVTAEAGE
jgi:hypothetical protein